VTPDQLRQLDKEHFWHPFTQMKAWSAPGHDPLVITSGKGVFLQDSEGNEYIDGNSSIWTNIHGHRHPDIDSALRDQIDRISHCSALGTTNEPAIRLAAELVKFFPADTLTKVFFTDDGSTAIECACKMALQYRQLTGQPERSNFLAFDQAYHGDTAGAASLGGIAVMHERFRNTGFPVTHISSAEDLDKLTEEQIKLLNAVCIEPLIQGAAGMQTWPAGMLAQLHAWCQRHDILLILDEVMTGFGRTGTMFACEQEDVTPDFIALAKGLTGGYLPLAATLTTERIYQAFLGDTEQLNTFFYGHSYSGNPLGCVAALANLAIFEKEKTLEQLGPKIDQLRSLLEKYFSDRTNVGAIRQCGLIAGIDIVQGNGAAYPWQEQTGHRICLEARRHGLLTRPVRDTLVLMPPLCITDEQLQTAVSALRDAVDAICTSAPGS
jgi:adenosylmethionine-8-amino-7-oxononanoate aminotransferase